MKAKNSYYVNYSYDRKMKEDVIKLDYEPDTPNLFNIVKDKLRERESREINLHLVKLVRSRET